MRERRAAGRGPAGGSCLRANPVSSRTRAQAGPSPMNRAAHAIARLRRLMPALPDLGPDGEFLSTAIRQYLREARLGLSLDDAFEVAPAPGEAAWWEAETAIETRARLIAELAEGYGGSISAKAKAIAAEASRYATDAWPRERHQAPSGSARRQAFWRLQSGAAGAAWPLGWRRILQILHSPSLSGANRVERPSVQRAG